jgi:hypothetical protein
MTEVDYLNQYLTECKEFGKDIFVGEIMNSFLNLKEKQFNIKSYKKSLKFRDMLALSITDDGSEFFKDL